MTTRRTILISILTGLFGLVIGVAGASQYWIDFYSRFNIANMMLQTQTDIVTKVAVLEHLRSGQIEIGTKLLESLLDGDLLAAGALARSGRKFNKNMLVAVEKERLAREMSGYESPDATVASSAKDVLRTISRSAEK